MRLPAPCTSPGALLVWSRCGLESGPTVVVGGATPFLPPVTEIVRLDLIETRTFGSRVIYERYRRVHDDSD
jgi:hypothetical protein